jgi:hypothetical protein
VIRLVPVYLNYSKVVRTVTQVAKESQSAGTMQQIRFALDKRVDIEGMTFPNAKDFVIRREGQSWIIEIEYEDPVPLFANLSIVPKFEASSRAGDLTE